MADNRLDPPTEDAARGTQGDEEAEALLAAWSGAAGELHGGRVWHARQVRAGVPTPHSAALSQVAGLNKTNLSAFHCPNMAAETTVHRLSQ